MRPIRLKRPVLENTINQNKTQRVDIKQSNLTMRKKNKKR